MVTGEVMAYCYMVKRGKPAAMVAVQERYRTEVIRIVADMGLQTYIEPLDDGWFTLWIYRYPHIFEVIKCLPQTPKTITDHWILGKLFGYDEEAIQEFLLKN